MLGEVDLFEWQRVGKTRRLIRAEMISEGDKAMWLVSCGNVTKTKGNLILNSKFPPSIISRYTNL